MQDLQTLLGALRRPRLLVRAARHGAADYRREAHLLRLLGAPFPARQGAVILQLMDLEAALDAGRRGRVASYSVARHIEVLAALIGEARTLAAAAEQVP